MQCHYKHMSHIQFIAQAWLKYPTRSTRQSIYDNNYAENYFDNGKGDDLDNLSDGSGGDEGGGEFSF